jgi:hypothetical protein
MELLVVPAVAAGFRRYVVTDPQKSIAMPPGDSREQREAEAYMIEALSKSLDITLKPGHVKLPEGGWLQVDGLNEEAGVFCEAFAHHNALKAGQVRKVILDAFKLAFLARIHPKSRLILLFCDETAAATFQGQRWFAQAIRQLNIEVKTVGLPAEMAERVRKAQRRQVR